MTRMGKGEGDEGSDPSSPSPTMTFLGRPGSMPTNPLMDRGLFHPRLEMIRPGNVIRWVSPKSDP